jgi:TusA-related sulfurtransferase
MQIAVDARGLSCPVPRQMAIEAIRTAKQGETIVVLVDTAAARDSIIRVVKAFQLPYKSVKKANGYEIDITREKLWMEK